MISTMIDVPTLIHNMNLIGQYLVVWNVYQTDKYQLDIFNLVLFNAHEKRGVADNMDESEEIFPEAAVEAAGLSSIKNLLTLF